jgi:ABC-type sugar transport system ATPase subunit
MTAHAMAPATDSPYAIELVGVTKRYGTNTVLSDLNLDIEPGEFLVLLGPSGCGKSTILKIIAGLEDATEGEVYITGRLANYVRPKERDVAMVFQNYALYPHMTIETNLGFPLKMRKLPRDAVTRRVAEIADLLGLRELLKRYPQQLSGGQRQRVALGRAIIREPVAFLMDEPLSNLDALLRVQMRTELLKLHRRVGKTTIYVTHDQVEAMTMANRIVILKDGVVQQVGSTTEVYDRPANTFVATFVGSPPMNLFSGHLANGGGQRGFVGAFSTSVAGEWPMVAEGAEVTLGIRPEHIAVVPAEHDAAIRGTVDLVEAVGAESYLSVSVGTGVTCMVRTAGRTRIRDGDRVGLLFPHEATHLFASDKTLIDRPGSGGPAPQ